MTGQMPNSYEARRMPTSEDGARKSEGCQMIGKAPSPQKDLSSQVSVL